VSGQDYEVPIPNRAGWSSNAPPRKGMNWCPSPRMKGETAELSKLMQNKREEKTTLKASVSSKKERGKSRLSRKEKAKVSARDVVAAVQVQVAPKPGDDLLKATAETAVITAMTGVKPGENLFREKKRGRPCKELLQQQQDQVLQNLHFKLNRFTPTDKKFVLERFNEMLDSILLSLLKGGGKEKKEKVPTKKAIEKASAKAADKKAAEDAMTKAAAGAADEPEPQIEEPDVKGVAAGSDATAPAPEESLPQIAEPKEAEAIVAAVVELGAREEVDMLKLEIERLIEVGRERQRALKQLDDDVESIFERLGELESGGAKAAAANALEWRLRDIEEVAEIDGQMIQKMWLMTDEGKEEQWSGLEEHGDWPRLSRRELKQMDEERKAMEIMEKAAGEKAAWEAKAAEYIKQLYDAKVLERLNELEYPQRSEDAQRAEWARLELERVEREIERLERYHGPYDSD